MRSLVQESLSVSGILLGRTMVRGEELSDRCTAESAEPADLAERPDAVELGDVRGAVAFEGVTFGYDPDVPPTLDGVDLDVPPGSFTAIVGETGSGKTTLAYLVARLYDVGAGRVTIDG